MAASESEWDALAEDPVFRTALGEVFKPLRVKAGTQESVAESGAFTIKTLQRIEQGRANEISFANFVRCAAAVQADALELVQAARAVAITTAPLKGASRSPGAIIGGRAIPVGREAERDTALRDLQEHVGIVFYGAPGQGKTALARYVAATMAQQFRDGVYEVDLENERQIENLPRLISSELGQPDLPNNYEVLRGRAVLLLLDSVDQVLQSSTSDKFRDALRSLVRSLSPDARLILTCQSRIEKSEFATREVLPLRDTDAVELFHLMSEGDYGTEPADQIREFVKGKLAGHPLSIKLVARYGRSVGLPFEDLQRLWDEKWEAIAEGDSSAFDERGLKASFELTFGALPSTAKLLFLVLGYLPDGISATIVRGIWPERETEIYEAVRVLRDRSLLEDMQASVARHNRLRGPLFLFAEAKRHELEGAVGPLAAELAAASLAIDGFYDHYIAANAPQFGDANPQVKNKLIRDEFHNIHASLDRRLEPSTERRTVAAATGVLSLYWAYHNNLSGAHNPISSTEDAIQYLEKAQAVFVGNSRSSDATRCTYYIGNIHWLRGDIGKAESYLGEAGRSQDTSEEVACDIQRAFAHIEYKEGDIRASVTKYLEVIDRAQGTYDDCVFRCWVGLLDAYRKLGRFQDGIDLFRAIEPRLGECRQDVAGNLKRGYGYTLAVSGQVDAAEIQYREALKLFLGNDFGQAHCWRGLGDILVLRGQFGAAENAFDTALALYNDAKKNPSLGVSLVELGRGRLALARGDHGGALQHFRSSADQLDRQHLNEPYELAVAHDLIGDVLATTGETDKAIAEHSIAASYFRRVGAEAIETVVRGKLGRLVQDTALHGRPARPETVGG